MSDFFEQKKENQRKFRQSLNSYMIQLPFLSINNQLNAENVYNLLDELKIDSLASQGKINLNQLYNLLKQQDRGHILNKSDFKSIFGCKKQVKCSQLAQILRRHDLNSFDIVEETQKWLWKDGKFSFKKLDQLMKKYHIKELNETNKQLLLKSFDLNNDKKITHEDLKSFKESLTQKKGMKKSIKKK